MRTVVRPISKPESVRVIDLSRASRGNYRHRRSAVTRALWFLIEATIINNHLMPLSGVRAALLRLFGAKLGQNCRLFHAIRVKCPWNLQIGDNSWLGEDVWLYNQDEVRIGSNVCISQGSFLTTGSHEIETTMDLRVLPIVIEDGVWISSRCVIQMGVTVGRSAIVTPLSVVHKSLEPNAIYGGNPCKWLRPRF
jgi:putative colanic acid biosynthesis acetyltransferase WcaF